MLKRFEKLQYMVIGAVLMAVGIGIGSIFTPPLVAQRDNVFDEITCRKLTVVDENGEQVLTMKSEPNKDRLTVYDDNGEKAFYFATKPKYNIFGVKSPNSVTDTPAVTISGGEEKNGERINRITVGDDKGNIALVFVSRPESNAIGVYDVKGNVALGLTSAPNLNGITVNDIEGNDAIGIISARDNDNTVSIFDCKTNKLAVSLGSREIQKVKSINGLNVLNDKGDTLISLASKLTSNYLKLNDEKGKEAIVLYGKSGESFLGFYDPLGELHTYTLSETGSATRTETIRRSKSITGRRVIAPTH